MQRPSVLFFRFEEGYCYLHQNCTFAHGQEECDYWEALYHKQANHLKQLEEKQLMAKSFREKIRRRIREEGLCEVVGERLFQLLRFLPEMFLKVA